MAQINLRPKVFTTLLGLLLIASTVSCVPVKLVAFSFTHSNLRLANFTIMQIETGIEYQLDHNGEVILDFPVGSNISFLVPEQQLNGKGESYKSTQTAIVEVPPGGLATELTEIALQIPSTIVYHVMAHLSDGKKDPTKCQVVVTVCNVNKTWYSRAQGMRGSTASLTPAKESMTFYFGTWGRLSNDTNPFPNNRTTVSWDGGVVFENVPVSADTEYVVTAQYPGYTFSETKFKCLTPGQFINAAPNQGPRASPVSSHRGEDGAAVPAPPAVPNVSSADGGDITRGR